MKDLKYKVCRENIYVGEVIKLSSGIDRHEGDSNFFYTKPGQLYPTGFYSFRSMLFTPNESKYSEDLLYNSPNYPVLNVTDDKTCLKLNINDIVVAHAYNLESLLKYFGYEEELTIEDIIKIRKTFFTGRFGMDNSRLFGMREFIPYNFHPEIEDLEEREELYKKTVNLSSERQFGSISTSVLSRELMDILDDRGRDTNLFSDCFKPNKEENNVKKLKRF